MTIIFRFEPTSDQTGLILLAIDGFAIGIWNMYKSLRKSRVLVLDSLNSSAPGVGFV